MILGHGSLKELTEKVDEVLACLVSGIISAAVAEGGSSAGVLDGSSLRRSVDNKVVDVVGYTSAGFDNSLDQLALLNVWKSLVDVHALSLVNRVGASPVRVSLGILILLLPLKHEASLISDANSACIWSALWCRG